MVSRLLCSTNIQIAKSNAIHDTLDLHYKASFHTCTQRAKSHGFCGMADTWWRGIHWEIWVQFILRIPKLNILNIEIFLRWNRFRYMYFKFLHYIKTENKPKTNLLWQYVSENHISNPNIGILKVYESENRKYSNLNQKIKIGKIEAVIRIEATQLTRRIVTALIWR